jgi:AcrR family transcriptional regulator
MNSREFMSGTNETPKKIIDVAIDLFAANGFKGTSIRDIAKTTGMTISNIYYYFGSKEGLLLAILEHSTRQIVEKLRQAAESDLEPIERFKLLLKTHLDLLIHMYRKEAKILFLDEEKLSRIRKQFQLEILNLYRRELQNLQSLGYINYSNVTILAFNIFGVLNWHIRWYKPEGRMSLEQINDEMLTFVLHGALSPSQTQRQPTRKS